MQRTEELSADVLPTLKKSGTRARKPAGLAGRIWKMALVVDWFLGWPWPLGQRARRIGESRRITIGDWPIKSCPPKRRWRLNQTTFTELAVADAPIHLARSTDERGYTIRAVFVCTSRGAKADVQNGAGRIFLHQSTPGKRAWNNYFALHRNQRPNNSNGAMKNFSTFIFRRRSPRRRPPSVTRQRKRLASNDAEAVVGSKAVAFPTWGTACF